MSSTQTYERIVYFGDSLTDSGAFFEIADQVLSIPFPSALFGYDGQFSDGDVYADIAPELLGIEVDNFAVGGARALGEAPAIFLPFGPLGIAFPDPDATPADIAEVSAFDINIGGQVDRFLDTLEDEPAAPGTAASIFIGLNDFNAFEPTDPTNPLLALQELDLLATSILDATTGAAQTLLDSGVETVYLNTLFPADFFPAFDLASPAIQAIGVTALEEYNADLIQAAEEAGSAIQIIDLNAIGTEIANDPSGFGFLNISDPFWFGTGADPAIVDIDGVLTPVFIQNPALDGLDPDQFAFFDFLHFTTALHGVVGAFTAASIEGDVIVMTDADDFVRTGQGTDVIFAGLGDDFVRSGRGEDVVFGGQGDDFIATGRGADIATGGSGDDFIYGARGSDVLAGGEGDDEIRGGAGRDVLIDGLGSDTLFGGSGSDAFLFTEAEMIGGTTGDDQDLFIGGRGFDTLYLALAEETRAAVEAALTGGRRQFLEDIGVTTIGIERFIFVDSRLDLAEIGTPARLEEADIWGLV